MRKIENAEISSSLPLGLEYGEFGATRSTVAAALSIARYKKGVDVPDKSPDDVCSYASGKKQTMFD